MQRSFLLFAATFAAMTGQAVALCKDGPPFACVINGKHGVRQCLGGHITPCVVVDQSQSTTTGKLHPKYIVLTIVYAPPGTRIPAGVSGNKSTSLVNYGAGSTTGTTTSATSSFKQDTSVTATVGAGVFGNGGSVALSFDENVSAANSKSIAITKTTNTTIQALGSSADGIDHDRDVIYLCLNPTVDLTVTKSSTSSSAVWTVSGDQADIQYAYVGWLKDPSKMPPGLAERLQHYGFTKQDYEEMLKRDPFAHGPAAITARYQALHMTFPYEPPYMPTDPVPTFSFTLSNAATSTASSSLQESYTVGLDIKSEASFIASASLEDKSSWTWSNSAAKSTSTATTQSAAVTVGGPGYGHTGPTDIEVFYDRIFKTFMFRALGPDQKPAIKGNVKGKDGKPVALKEVIVVANGTKYRTFTDAKGDYRVYGSISGPITIRANGATRQLSGIDTTKSVELRM